MSKILERLSSAEDDIKKLQDQLSSMKNNHQGSSEEANKNNSNNENNANSNVSDKQFENLKKDLKDKLDVINKKINNLQSESNQHDKDISYLKDHISQGHEDNAEESGEKEGKEGSLDANEAKKITIDLSALKKKLEEVDNRERKDVKELHDEINLLKMQLKHLKAEKIESKTSIED